MWKRGGLGGRGNELEEINEPALPRMANPPPPSLPCPGQKGEGKKKERERDRKKKI